MTAAATRPALLLLAAACAGNAAVHAQPPWLDTPAISPSVRFAPLQVQLRDAAAATAIPGAGGPNLKRCMCRDGVQFDVCAALDCASTPAHDIACSPLCAPHEGLLAAACYPSAPVCVSR